MNLLSDIKIGKEIVMFGNVGIEKQKFHRHKRPILIVDVNILKTIVSKKVSFGKKGFR